MKNKVICVHIGARSHYLFPQALADSGLLHVLITDVWIANKFLRRMFAHAPLRILRALAGRYSETIAATAVYSFGLHFVIREFYLRTKYPYSWDLTIARDKLFERLALPKMHRIQGATAVLGISYTALKCFEAAKDKRLKTILFQVDPGLSEEKIVASLRAKHQHNTTWQPAPESYWKHWAQECALADTILVNSDWSKKGLIEQGLEEEKIKVIPLPFDLEQQHKEFIRTPILQFSRERPLRCLFLGTLALRKGIYIVLEAAQKLKAYPIEFVLVGRSELPIDAFIGTSIRYEGLVTRKETEQYYKQADVFLFPTFSDGFGLTQLEAMAWQLPVIATPNCGTVVQHQLNGLLIEPGNTDELVGALKQLCTNPSDLNKYALNCLSTVEQFSTEKFAADLAKLI